MNSLNSLMLLLVGLLLWNCQTQKKSQYPESPIRPQPSGNGYEEGTAHVVYEVMEIPPYRASRERKFDLLHTSLDLALDFEQQTVEGEAVLTLRPYFYEQNKLELDAKDFDIHQVKLMGAIGEDELASRYDGQKLKVYLPGEFKRSDTLNIKIKYTAYPNQNSGIGSKVIKDNKGLYFINPEQKEGGPVQVWTQGETEYNSKWFPTVDAPNERATHDIRITVAEKYSTISNGALIGQEWRNDGSRTDHWRMDMPHAPYLVALVVGEFAMVESSWEDIPLRYYVEEKYQEGAAHVFGDTPEMMGFFSDLLGVRYPWPKYDQVVVRDFVSGAMENTTLSVFMEELNLDRREALDNEWEGIIAHELFHHWFGNYVTTESWANLPLNESFANYGEYLWYEYKKGKDAADLHHVGEMEMYLHESEEKQENLIRFDYQDREDMFDSHSYAKGGRVLHMLRKYLGDEAFFAGLNYYLRKNALSSVEIHDLRLAMEHVTGKDLNWFFNQWFLASGHPMLEIKFDHSVPDNILLTVRQKQSLAQTPLYKIPFKVSWYQGKERKEKGFVLEKSVQEFALENGGEVDLVLFDEDWTILSERETFRGQDILSNQFHYSQIGIARYEALDSLRNGELEEGRLRSLLNRALRDEFWPVRELALTAIAESRAIGQMEEMEKEVLKMAGGDPNNNVRASAIELLSRKALAAYCDLFLEWGRDSSYYVAGASLEAYLMCSDASDKLVVAQKFEEAENVRMLIPLMDYYTRERISGKGRWMHDKLAKMRGRSLYYFLGYYGDYFVRIPEEGSETAVENLMEIAKHHRNGYIRLAAFQALFGFMDAKEVLEKAKDINQNEEELEIKQAQEYFLAPYINEN